MPALAVVLIVPAVLVIGLVVKLVFFGAGAIIRGVVWLVQWVVVGRGRLLIWLVYGV